MKRNWFLIIILFLLVANAALVSTYLITSNTRNKNTPRGNFSWGLRPNASMQPVRFDNYIRDRINLSSEQIEKVNEFRQEFQTKKRENDVTLFEFRTDYIKELSKDNPDEEKLNNLADSIGYLQAQIMLQEYRHYRNLRSVCTEEQVRAFDSLGKEHMFNRNNDRMRGSERGWRQRQNEPRN